MFVIQREVPGAESLDQSNTVLPFSGLRLVSLPAQSNTVLPFPGPRLVSLPVQSNTAILSIDASVGLESFQDYLE